MNKMIPPHNKNDADRLLAEAQGFLATKPDVFDNAAIHKLAQYAAYLLVWASDHPLEAEPHMAFMTACRDHIAAGQSPTGLPCPACGEPALGPRWDDNFNAFAMCCHCQQTAALGQTKEEVIAAWKGMRKPKAGGRIVQTIAGPLKVAEPGMVPEIVICGIPKQGEPVPDDCLLRSCSTCNTDVVLSKTSLVYDGVPLVCLECAQKWPKAKQP